MLPFWSHFFELLEKIMKKYRVISCQASWTLQLDPLQIFSKFVRMLYIIIDLETENFSSISIVLYEM